MGNIYKTKASGICIPEEDLNELGLDLELISLKGEIEDLTPYPVPKTGRRDVLLDYRKKIAFDSEIKTRKKNIALRHIADEWSDRCRTTDGIRELAEYFPDYSISFTLDHELRFAAKINRQGIEIGSGMIWRTFKEFSENLPKIDGVRYTSDGVDYFLRYVGIDIKEKFINFDLRTN